MGMESSVLELTFPGWSKLEPKKNWHTLLHNRVSTWTPTQTEKDYLLQLSEKWPSASGAVSDQVKSFTQLMPIRTNVCTKQILVVHGIGVEDARQTTNRMGWQHVLSNEFDWHDDTGSLTLPFWRHVAVPNSAYVDLHELSARNFVDLCSLKETSMCVRGAAIADVAEMWGVSADVPLWGKWPHGDADRWMWSEIEGCWWALPSMCGLMTAMCSHTTGDSWLPWTGRMFAGFSRYGRKRIEGLGACRDRLFNVTLEILWTLCTCIPLSKGRFNFPGDYEIFHICNVMPELRRFSRLLDCGDMAASAGPDNSSQCEPSRQTRHGKTRWGRCQRK